MPNKDDTEFKFELINSRRATTIRHVRVQIILANFGNPLFPFNIATNPSGGFHPEPFSKSIHNSEIPHGKRAVAKITVVASLQKSTRWQGSLLSFSYFTNWTCWNLSAFVRIWGKWKLWRHHFQKGLWCHQNKGYYFQKGLWCHQNRGQNAKPCSKTAFFCQFEAFKGRIRRFLLHDKVEGRPAVKRTPILAILVDSNGQETDFSAPKTG